MVSPPPRPRKAPSTLAHAGLPARFALLACLLTSAGSGCHEAAPPRPEWNVVLVTVDTYRGDHFLTERAGEALTPRLAQLAERSLVYTSASSAGCETSPGTAAIMTGLLPRRSGVTQNVNTLPGSFPTIATVLRSRGARTAAFVANPVLGPGHGFEEGYEVFECIRTKNKKPPRRITEAALDWLAGIEDSERFLLWAHYMNPHGPYVPPDRFRELFPLDAFGPESPAELLPAGNNSGRGGIPFYQHRVTSPGMRDARHYLASYAAEVRFMDEEVGRLLDALEERGLLERSIVVFTSDHGEAHVDDAGYYFSHGNGVTEDQVHVPLLVAYPGCEPGTVEEPVSTVDAFPTLLRLLDLPAPAELDGADLSEGGSRDVVSQTPTRSALRRGAYKLVRRSGKPARLLQLVPGNAPADVTGSEPERLEELRAALDALESRPGLAASVSRKDPSRELLQQLEELGYAGDEGEEGDEGE